MLESSLINRHNDTYFACNILEFANITTVVMLLRMFSFLLWAQ